jgi:zinc/manganese transport system substrate-binding protein
MTRRDRSGCRRDWRAAFRLAVLSIPVLGLLAFQPVRADTAVTAGDTPPLPVVATFSVLADLVRQVGGARVDVRSLVAPGNDTHVFQPGASHARQLAAAKLVVANGLGFEGWMDRLVRSSGYGGPVVVATTGVRPIRNGGADPHAWQSVPNVRIYVANIATALCEVAPDGCQVFRDNAARYDESLVQLDAEIRQAIAAVPKERRRVMTSHGAFAYYAREYGVTFLSPVGISTEAEPSAASVARLIRQIRQRQVHAFFLENITDPRLIERIRDETGGAMPGRLYSDGLSGPDGPASDYLAMMRENTRALTWALSAPASAPAAPR